MSDNPPKDRTLASESLRRSNGTQATPPVSISRPRPYATPEQRNGLLKAALQEIVASGISIRVAADAYGVAKSSLSDYIRRSGVQLSPAGRNAKAGIIKARASSSSSPRSRGSENGSPNAASATATATAMGLSQAGGKLPTLVPWTSSASSQEPLVYQQCQQAPPPGTRWHEQEPESQKKQETTLAASSSSLLGCPIVFSNLLHSSNDSYQREAAAGTKKRKQEELERETENGVACKRKRGLSSSSCGMTSTATAATVAKSAVANLSQQLCEFVNRSPSPFHAVAESRRMLEAAGFSQLREDQPWEGLRPNQRSFVTRNGSTIFAFVVGGRWKPGNGFSIVGAHTDSPCLRIKPVSNRESAGDVVQCGVETYGGGLWYTWFDRDLTAAGRAVVRKSGGGLADRLVNIGAPIFKVPSLAIHLNRGVNDDGFAPHRENHLAPILCRKVQELVSAADGAAAASTAGSGQQQQQKHPQALLARVAESLGCQPEDIVDLELYLADTQPAQVTGIASDFVSAPRLDNLLSCFAALTALIEAPGLDTDPNCRVICLYDHEEIGSQSAQGAASSLTQYMLRRLSQGADNFDQAVPRSLMVSADVAHAVHPNYEDRHERRHRPSLFGGIVVKTNVNQRYATNAITGALLRECLRLAEPSAALQEFVVRQDLPCGSTIGPILAAGCALPTIDVGAPILGMHSCRETGSAVGPGQCVQLFSAFFQHYPALRDSLATSE